MINNSKDINKILNNITDDIRKNRNIKKNINILERMLEQPYAKARIKDLLFHAYLNAGMALKAYNVIKELYDTTRDERALFDYVGLLLNIGEISKARYYVENIDYSEMKIFLLGLINKYEGNYDEAIKYLNKLSHTVMEEDMRIELGNIYEYLGELEKAKKEFCKLLNTDRKYQAKVRLIKIAMGENDPKIFEMLSSFNVNMCHHQGDLLQFRRCLKYYKYLTNTLTKDDLDNYISNQLFNYNKNLAIEFIKNRYIEANNLYQLNNDLDLKEVYEYCSNNLDCLLKKQENDVYLVKMPYEVGNILGNKTSLLEVITIPNTNKIITLYPVAEVGMYTKQLKELKKHEKRKCNKILYTCK